MQNTRLKQLRFKISKLGYSVWRIPCPKMQYGRDQREIVICGEGSRGVAANADKTAILVPDVSLRIFLLTLPTFPVPFLPVPFPPCHSATLLRCGASSRCAGGNRRSSSTRRVSCGTCTGRCGPRFCSTWAPRFGRSSRSCRRVHPAMPRRTGDFQNAVWMPCLVLVVGELELQNLNCRKVRETYRVQSCGCFAVF